jgi:type IV pilus modification protein PilV
MSAIARHPGSAGEAGFTIVEVMVAVTMLAIGVLAMLVMIQGSLSSTRRTVAREQATNLARELVERSREIPYATTTTSAAPAALAAKLPESPAVSGSSFAVQRRNITYSVTVSACSIDDPTDGAGVGDATFCDAPLNSTGPGSAGAGSGLAIGPNILGLPVSLAVGGSLITTLCNAIGTNTAIANQISSLTSSLLAQGKGAVLSVCPSGSVSEVAYDTTPDDLRRIRVRVQWTGGGHASSLDQTTLLTSPA